MPTSHLIAQPPSQFTPSRQHLVAADLHLAGLSSAQLPGADLRRANLHEAWLRDSCLHGADLRDADLRGAHLEGADIDAADLRGAELDGADFRGSTFSRGTAWPAGVGPVGGGAGGRRRVFARCAFLAGDGLASRFRSGGGRSQAGAYLAARYVP